MYVYREGETVGKGVRESDFKIIFKTSLGSNVNKNINICNKSSTSQKSFAPLPDKNHLQWIHFLQVYV